MTWGRLLFGSCIWDKGRLAHRPSRCFSCQVSPAGSEVLLRAYEIGFWEGWVTEAALCTCFLLSGSPLCCSVHPRPSSPCLSIRTCTCCSMKKNKKQKEKFSLTDIHSSTTQHIPHTRYSQNIFASSKPPLVSRGSFQEVYFTVIKSTLRKVIPMMEVIELEKAIQNSSLTLTEVINKTTSAQEGILVRLNTLGRINSMGYSFPHEYFL